MCLPFLGEPMFKLASAYNHLVGQSSTSLEANLSVENLIPEATTEVQPTQVLNATSIVQQPEVPLTTLQPTITNIPPIPPVQVQDLQQIVPTTPSIPASVVEQLNQPTNIPVVPTAVEQIQQIVPTVVVFTDPTPTLPPVISTPIPIDNSNPINNVPTAPPAPPIVNNGGTQPIVTQVPPIVNQPPANGEPIVTQVPQAQATINPVNPNLNQNGTITQEEQIVTTPIVQNGQGAIGVEEQVWEITSDQALQNSVPVSDPGKSVLREQGKQFSAEYSNETINKVTIEQKENFFEINVEPQTRIFLITTSNICKSFVGMAFKSNTKISGKLYILESEGLEITSDNSQNSYSKCRLASEGFTEDDLDDVKMRVRYSKDWLEDNAVQKDSLKVYSDLDNDQKLEKENGAKEVAAVKVDDVEYEIIEAEFQELPSAFGIAGKTNEQESSKNEISAAGSTINVERLKYLALIMASGLALGLFTAVQRRKKYQDVTEGKAKPFFW